MEHSSGWRGASHLSFLVSCPQSLQVRTMKRTDEPAPETCTNASTRMRQWRLWRLLRPRRAVGASADRNA
eukprot:8452096-Pyramimonas_sp.AAC.1